MHMESIIWEIHIALVWAIRVPYTKCIQTLS